MAMSELEMLQRDIDAILESNRLDWLALANESMTSVQRITIRKSISVRDVELGSGLIDQSQKMTSAAIQIADMNVCAHRS